MLIRFKHFFGSFDTTEEFFAQHISSALNTLTTDELEFLYTGILPYAKLLHAQTTNAFEHEKITKTRYNLVGLVYGCLLNPNGIIFDYMNRKPQDTVEEEEKRTLNTILLHIIYECEAIIKRRYTK